MMEEKKNVFDYISEIFATFGIITGIFMILVLVVGDQALGYSSFFEYGKQALSITTLFQLLGLSFIISVCKNILLTDRWIKQMSMLIRNILFFLAITVAIILFVILFKWFPLFDLLAWIGFIVSFAFCCALAIVVSKIRENSENWKMEQALDKFKGKERDL